MSRLAVAAVAAVVLSVMGCSETAGVVAQQQRVMEGAAPEEVLNEAAVVLQREFGRAQVDRAGLRVITGPVEFTTDRESGTARDLYRGRSLMRRSATLTVARVRGATVARLRVDVERQDTVQQTVMQPQGSRMGDTPGSETAIDRDAATTQKQNAVWTRVRRDTRLERALLDELRERLARRAADLAPADTEADVPQPAPTPPAEPRE